MTAGTQGRCRSFMTGAKLIEGKRRVHTPDIIERAFQLARETDNVDQIRKRLRSEGYSNVDAHLAGSSIKAELKRQFVR